MRQRAIAPLLFALLAAAGCATAGGGADAADRALEGEVWRWVGLRGPEPLDVDHPGRYTLEFTPDGRYLVRADCNTGSGSYRVEGDHVHFGLGMLTQAACDPRSLDLRFLTLFRRVDHFAREGDLLLLYLSADSGAMEFAARRHVTVQGITWLVRAYNNGEGGVVSAIPGTPLWAVFGDDGRVTGSAGCNRFFAPYTLDGEQLSIGPVGASRKACSRPAGALDQERAFLAALGTTASWSMQGERLLLKRADGAQAVELIAAVTGRLVLPAATQLPPGATLTIAIDDISRVDAPGRTIGEEILSADHREPPFAFDVSYDPADIDARHIYSVRARIAAADGKLLFVTPQPAPVITRGRPSIGLEVALEAVR